MLPELPRNLRVLRTGVGLCLLIAALLAQAANAQAVNLDTAGITAQEMLSLPEYCRARYGADAALRDYWSKQLGTKQFLHVHHYCGGLNFMRRASLATNANQRRIRLQAAINEFDYVLRNWPPDFSLSVQAKQQKTLAKAMLGR